MKKLKVAMLAHTVPVSVTGTVCQLRCKHCNAHYLQHMTALWDLKISPTTKSFLVSGGSTIEGKVPVYEHIEEIKILKAKGYRLNFHVGLVNDDGAKVLSEIADGISFDFVGDDDTIRYVYNLKKSVSDYIKTFETLIAYSSKVFPHITVGLRCGRLSHEFKAIDLLSRYQPSKVVFIVFIPTPRTDFSRCPVPDLEDIKKVFSYARQKFDHELILGCMYPHGKYRDAITRAAVDSAFNTITQPSKKFVDLLVQKGYQLEFSDECCVL